MSKAKTILITGLDASGKSTLLGKLKNLLPNESFLFLPKIHTADFQSNKEILSTANFLNTLGEKADQENNSQLKALALMGSMLLFNTLSNNVLLPESDFLICERHPVIDTGIYAHFYAQKLKPENLDNKQLQKLDEEYYEELFLLNKLLPIEYQNKNMAEGILTFINKWFCIEQNYAFSALENLFGTKLPDRIFFLNAPAEVLANRIAQRSNKEPHENIETLQLLQAAYSKLLYEYSAVKPASLTKIDASEIKNLDQAPELIIQTMKS
ncbi:MAG: hypothetical protein C0594_01370 [Marinilabiliales bacterium]|nr:MAG: hypothetical protein C0594_01370 [Marinilabiliales bacterium]